MNLKHPCTVAATALMSLFLAACVGTPPGVEPVDNFELDRYLGKWYEIARLDHDFERGLDNVTAQYTLRDDGGVRVINSGYTSDNVRNEAEGKAYFVTDEDLAHLKVSFFGPFYGSYIVFELEKNYEYAFVSGPKTSYLWLLARQPQVSEEVMRQFESRAAELGFDLDELILVNHDGT